jgi:hypothetical protein
MLQRHRTPGHGGELMRVPVCAASSDLGTLRSARVSRNLVRGGPRMVRDWGAHADHVSAFKTAANARRSARSAHLQEVRM